MKGFVGDIEGISEENGNFRKVIYTGKNLQLVVMSLAPGDDIGEEVHEADQFLRVEAGEGEAILDDVAHDIADDYAIFVPAGTKHNIVNTGKETMKLYTLYSPPQHRDGLTEEDKPAEESEEDKFDGKTTE